VDWSLIDCGRKGHVTYAPSEAGVRQHLRAQAESGEAWRCLRCGAYVTGEPLMSGPAADAPVVLRGKEVRSALILRVFAVERFLRALAVAAIAFVVWRFEYARETIEQAFDRERPELRNLFHQLGYNIDNSKLVGLFNRALTLSPTTIKLLAIGLACYAAIEVVEGVGLWVGKRWGEYFAMVATSVGLPFEIYDLVNKVSTCAGAKRPTTPGCAANPSWTVPSPPQPPPTPADQRRPRNPDSPRNPRGPRLPPQALLPRTRSPARAPRPPARTLTPGRHSRTRAPQPPGPPPPPQTAGPRHAATHPPGPTRLAPPPDRGPSAEPRQVFGFMIWVANESYSLITHPDHERPGAGRLPGHQQALSERHWNLGAATGRRHRWLNAACARYTTYAGFLTRWPAGVETASVSESNISLCGLTGFACLTRPRHFPGCHD